MTEIVKRTVLLFLLVFISCAPRVRVPDVNELGFDVPGKFEGDTLSAVGFSLDARWWRDFRQDAIEKLATSVIENNLDVKEAEAGVREKEALLGSARGKRYPSLDLSSGASRSKIVYRGIGAGDISSIVENYEVDLAPSYEVDLLGRVRDAVSASFYDYLSAGESRKTVLDGVVAEAVSLAFEETYLREQISLARKRVNTAKTLLAAVEGRYAAGLSQVSDVLQARRSLHEASSVLPDLEMSASDVRRRLSVLAGNYPTSSFPYSLALIDVRTLPPVPSGMPSEVLERRPDVKAALISMKAQYERVSAAWKNRFPKITLTGSLGYSSDELRNLVSPGSEIWNIALGILAPIFDGGTLRSLQKAEEARFTRFVVAYAKTILQAFYEVEVALETERNLFEKRAFLVNEVDEAEKVLEVVMERYGRGLSDFLDLLTARDRYYSAQQKLLDVDLAILKNRVFLYRALGGCRFVEAKGKSAGLAKEEVILREKK